jgi:hypothetical protein
VITHFNQSFGELERVNDHQFVVKIEWNFEIVCLDVLVGVKKNIMGIFVISELLFLLGNVDGDFNSLLDISNRSVQLESPLWLFWNIIGFTHKIINKLVCQSIVLDLTDHLDHIWDFALTFGDVEFECFVVVFTLLVVFGGLTPL